MTGQLQGTLFGRPVALEGHKRALLLRISGLRSAWRLRRSVAFSLIPLLQVLRDLDFTVQVRIAPGLTINVLPTPNAALGLLMPALHVSQRGAKS